MYVTRRLLRSTLPPEGVDTSQEKPMKPPKTQTPKRRPKERAKEKAEEAKGGRTTTKSSTENAGDEKNKRRNKKPKEAQEQPQDDEEALFGLEKMVDVRYNSQYIEARVMQLDVEQQRLYVHYMGWNARYDAWVTPEDLAAHGSESGAKKKEHSWDGETPLFATCDEAAQFQLSKKKKTPKAKRSARKAPSAAEPSGKDRKRRGEAAASERPNVKIGRKSPTNAKKEKAKSPKAAKTAKALKKKAKSPRTAKSPKHAAAEDEETSEQVAKSPRVRRNSRRVQVAVGTTDEASESTKEGETADLVLDVEIEDREDPHEEPDAEEQEERVSLSRAKRTARGKSKRKRKVDDDDDDDEDFVPEKKVKEPKRGGSSKSSATGGMVLPQRSGRGGLSSPTRKKLQQVFRQRVQERQQMEQLNASQMGFQESLQAEADDAASADASSSSPTSTKTETAAAMASPTAGADEYQRQLQQYYYHQQVMLANSLAMSMTGGCEDFSSVALQNGIMDPRIIQERLNALEERRRQQAQIQAYYQQLMLTRERNVRAMAANQAFVNASAAVWEQQLRECTQSEDDASVKSWKDVAEPSTDKDTRETSKGDGTADDTAPSNASADEAAKSNDGNGNDNDKESEVSAAASTSTQLASPDTVEKAAESSTQSTPAKSSSSKTDPDAPSENVLYEFIL